MPVHALHVGLIIAITVLMSTGARAQQSPRAPQPPAVPPAQANSEEVAKRVDAGAALYKKRVVTSVMNDAQGGPRDLTRAQSSSPAALHDLVRNPAGRCRPTPTRPHEPGLADIYAFPQARPQRSLSRAFRSSCRRTLHEDRLGVGA